MNDVFFLAMVRWIPLAAQFIRELFKPQEMYTSSSTREIFNKLAHSSIMRLNESSMEKLYDLMTMGFKHQVTFWGAFA
jgi:hypothetical protein